MKRVLYFSTSVLALSLAIKTLSPQAIAQTPATGTLDPAQLKATIAGLGYDVTELGKEPGKESYQFKVETGGLNIPIAAEVSPSKQFIWFTIRLVADQKDIKYEELLKTHANSMPSFFYITPTNSLNVAIPLENRAVTPALVKRNIELVTKTVADTKAIWLK